MKLAEALRQLEEHFQGNEDAQSHIQALKELANGTSDDPPPQPPGGPF